MDLTADGLVRRAVHELAPQADELIVDVARRLRSEVPELWDDPHLVRMTSENIAEHVRGVLAGLELGIEPSGIEPPSAAAERARELARRGISVTVMGHVLPAVVTRDGTADLLDLPPGPPLGLGGLPFEATDIDLPEGSLLALYTDGLIEARDHDLEMGINLLRHALAQPSASLEDACDIVLQSLLPTDHSHDDVALLLARTPGPVRIGLLRRTLREKTALQRDVRN
ncbi:SpoIIE family protein phosphatase [Streptomyces sp. CoH27]|uniref:SpoIIE family protein phosphatase n=1 Tax=Streptomyces sp. CoH27 TaxID=2875763 RepID=UPI0035A957F7